MILALLPTGDFTVYDPLIAVAVIGAVLPVAHWARKREHKPLSPRTLARVRAALEAKEWRE